MGGKGGDHRIKQQCSMHVVLLSLSPLSHSASLSRTAASLSPPSHSPPLPLLPPFSPAHFYASPFSRVSVQANTSDAGAAFKNHLDGVRRYMKYRNIPLDMQAGVLKYFDYLWSVLGGVDESTILDELPGSVRTQVSFWGLD